MYKYALVVNPLCDLTLSDALWAAKVVKLRIPCFHLACNLDGDIAVLRNVCPLLPQVFSLLHFIAFLFLRLQLYMY